MTIYGWLIFAPWLTLVGYWGLSARALKRRTGIKWIWWREIAVRLAFFAFVVLALQVAVLGHALPDAPPYALNVSVPMGVIGLLFSLLGIALAIVARGHLSRNRPMPGSK